MRHTLFLFALTLPLIGLGQTPTDTLSRFLEPAAVTAVRATERAPFAAETLDAEEIAGLIAAGVTRSAKAGEEEER